MQKTTYPFYVGAEIVATKAIIEENFPEKGTTHTHAIEGDTGTVVYIYDDDSMMGYPTVRFHKSGTATVVGDGEIGIDLSYHSVS